jgi:UDP-N-acetylglucosamine--N-acetylmuramyl-(pentapeptide) pyrophosphoryl-undecaprenol N-acetylglucosamine transferase
MNRFFPDDRIALTGNPVRRDLETPLQQTDEALHYFGLLREKPVLLILGGSLGSGTINNGMRKGLNLLLEAGVQVIWQTGSIYFESISKDMPAPKPQGLWINDFIARMDYAYAAADLVVSRAGAGTISELCLQRKAVILVPSPNVSEDHQTKNAMSLVNEKAAVLLPDKEAENELAQQVLSIITNDEKLQSLREHIALFAQHNSADRIVDEVEKCLNIKK